MLAGALLLLLGAGIAAWSLGWLDDWLGDGLGQAQTEEADRRRCHLAPLQTDRDRIRQRIPRHRPDRRSHPRPGRRSEQAGDCDAALLLYNQAAERDAALGIQVARLYDPIGFAEGGCIDAASEDTALEYYLNAATPVYRKPCSALARSSALAPTPGPCTSRESNYSSGLASSDRLRARACSW
jgi:hypothetical protein